MARLAVGSSGSFVVEVRLLPVVGVVACRALSMVMVGRLIGTMAGAAVGGTGSLMIEAGRLPGAYIVAGGALRLVVVGRFIGNMARSAVRGERLIVIEENVVPVIRGVAASAVSIKMHDRLYIRVASLALAGSPCELPGHMAAFTGKSGVGTQQRIKGMFGTPAAWGELYAVRCNGACYGSAGHKVHRDEWLEQAGIIIEYIWSRIALGLLE